MKTYDTVIGKPTEIKRTEEAIEVIAYVLTQRLSKNFNQGLLVFFTRYAGNDCWFDFKLTKTSEDINLVGQLIERYTFTAKTANEPKYIASIDKLVINGQEFYSIQD